MPGEVIAAVATAGMGLLAVIVAKSKCLFRSVDEEGLQWGVAFSDRQVMPDNGKYEKVDLNQDVLILKK